MSDYDERIRFVETGLSGCHFDQSVLDMSNFGQKIKHNDILAHYFVLGDCR